MLALQNAPDDRRPSLFQAGNKLGVILACGHPLPENTHTGADSPYTLA
jgi:hypothetical protein